MNSSPNNYIGKKAIIQSAYNYTDWYDKMVRTIISAGIVEDYIQVEVSPKFNDGDCRIDIECLEIIDDKNNFEQFYDNEV